MTEAIELGQRSQWRNTASLSTTEAHDLAARLESRARAEDEAAAREASPGLAAGAPGERMPDVGCGSGVVTRTLRNVHARPAVLRSVRWVGADAKDCSNAILLPVDTAITPPAADVPADLAQFSGAWGGAWTDRAGRPGACTALVVEEAFANGYVRAVLANSVGVLDPHMLQPRYWRAAGRVVAGTLRFELPIPTRPEFTTALQATTWRGPPGTARSNAS